MRNFVGTLVDGDNTQEIVPPPLVLSMRYPTFTSLWAYWHKEADVSRMVGMHLEEMYHKKGKELSI